MMLSKKTPDDFELLFYLHWRASLENGGDKFNYIGMCDTEATTGKFEAFKCYLLKNSGVNWNIRVTFINHETEWEIKSQSDFENAVCAFRLKARSGKHITLRLDRIRPGSGPSESTGAVRKQSSDAETQFNSLQSAKADEPSTPPEWFLNYMAKFKCDIIEEITTSLKPNLHDSKKKVHYSKKETTPKKKEEKKSEPIVQVASAPPLEQPAASTPPTVTSFYELPLSKRIKHEHKRRKLVIGDTIDKELLRNLKFERKLEIKLDKLDAKTKKIKEKKQALMTKIETDDAANKLVLRPKMNAALISDQVVPRMIGGELYLHIWDVRNTGLEPWTNDTELRLSWGSAELKPRTNVIKCPLLQPGENGSICVHFDIPKKPGTYESYWLFYDKDIRFGSSLRCCLIVEGVYYGILGCNPRTEEAKTLIPQEQSPVSNVERNIQENTTIEEKPVHVYEKLENDNQEGVDCDVIDLSTRMQDMALCFGHNWNQMENLYIPLYLQNSKGTEEVQKEKKIYTDSDLDKSPIKYGICEDDLIVDLSTSNSDKDEAKIENTEQLNEDVQSANNNNHDSNNNNNEANHESSEESSVCDLSSEISSGYDVIAEPAGENEVDEEFDCVYVMPEDKKSPTRSFEFVQSLYPELPPLSLEQGAVNSSTMAQVEKLKNELDDLEQNLQETRSFLSHCSTTGSCYSDANSNLKDAAASLSSSRLFMFPQNNPGFEVVQTKSAEIPSSPPTTVYCPTNTVDVVPSDPLQTYTWALSRGSYSLAEGQTTGGVTIPKSRFDPYGCQQMNFVPQSPPQQQQEQNPFVHVPNYQQSGGVSKAKEMNSPPPPQRQDSATSAPEVPRTTQSETQTTTEKETLGANMHILPENLVTGAVNVASSAISTARSVINMIVPKEPGRWKNGHWVTEDPNSTRAQNLKTLQEMGFWDTDLNATLLARYNDDMTRVISDLVQ